MADDGMLLNFSIPASGILVRPSVKGGRWKDRLVAKKAAQNWHSKATARLNEDVIPKTRRPNVSGGNSVEVGIRTKKPSINVEDPIQEDERRPKRVRVSGEFSPVSGGIDTQDNFKPQSKRTLTKASDTNQSTQKGGKQIISSLFTYNPTSTTTTGAKTHHASDVSIEPSNAPLDGEVETFTSLGITTTLATHLFRKMDLKAPTAIQKAAISQLLKENADAFIQAQTGSGKTLAYLLPIVQRLMELSANVKKRTTDEAVHRDSGLFAIIMAPTRELSKQIALVLEKLLRCAHWLVATTVIGGEKKKSEKARLRKGINILVATPGRLVDHLEHTEALDVSNVRWLVLDEGDRLMELGFEQDIQKIISVLNIRMRSKKGQNSDMIGLPERRTTVLCSATMKMDVERLGHITLKDAALIQADPQEKSDTHTGTDEPNVFLAPAQLRQSYAIVAPKLRLVSLISFLRRAFARKGSVMKAIVFFSCADSVDFHFDVLTSQLEDESNNGAKEGQSAKETNVSNDINGKKSGKPIQADPTNMTTTYAVSSTLSPKTNVVTAYRLHGSLQQSSRTSTLAHFVKNKEPTVLLATDVASRGLDVSDVDLVIEFDPAFARDDHIHRIGRTARAGRDGRACIFLMPGCEEGYVSVLRADRKNAEAASHISRYDADDILNRGLVTSGVVDKRLYMEKATDLQLAVERWALASPSRLEAARRAFQSHVRAYATHVADERNYFDIKQLHLGHLAKAFALRERPSGMKVPGLRTGTGREDGRPAKARGQTKENATDRNKEKAITKGQELDLPESHATDEAAKMRKAVRAREKFMRHAGMASEFNLG